MRVKLKYANGAEFVNVVDLEILTELAQPLVIAPWYEGIQVDYGRDGVPLCSVDSFDITGEGPNDNHATNPEDYDGCLRVLIDDPQNCGDPSVIARYHNLDQPDVVWHELAIVPECEAWPPYDNFVGADWDHLARYATAEDRTAAYAAYQATLAEQKRAAEVATFRRAPTWEI